MRARAALLLALGAAIVAGTGLWYQSHRAALLRAGYDKAMGEVREAANDRLREALRETARLTAEIKGVQDEYQKSRGEVDRLLGRLRAADERLRLEKDDFERRIAAASADSLRRYASEADGNLDRCRADVARFGAEAASCAAAAHALKANLDAIETREPDSEGR